MVWTRTRSRGRRRGRASAAGALLPVLAQISLLAPLLFLARAQAQAQAQAHQHRRPPCRVAVIGAGVGGSAAAYYWRGLLLGEEGDCAITVFEREMRVGGRVENVSFDGKPLEIGASILYSKNQHMVEAIEALGLHAGPPVWSANGSSEGADGTMGLWDSDRAAGRLVFRSSPWDLVTALRVLWRYGPVRMWRLRRLVADTLQRFMAIYELQGAGGEREACPTGFATPEALWEALGLYELTQVSLRSYLGEQGVGAADSNIVREFVGSVNRVNYNQGNDLNALAGLVSLCPTVTGEVVSVQEGNARVAEAMLQAAGARLRLNVSVGTIRILHDKGSSAGGSSSSGVYQLEAADGSDLGQFDAVVVAAPFALSSIAIVDPEEKEETGDTYPPLTYQHTHATFVEGGVRPGFFGPGTGSAHGTPGSVYVVENASTPLSSIALHVRVNATHAVYKLFSTEALDDAFLDALFLPGWSTLHYRDWQAYPRYHPPDDEMCPFVLKPFERIFYTSALETAVSAMEIAAIAGKNVAILLAQSLGRGPWGPGGRCRGDLDGGDWDGGWGGGGDKTAEL